jgi:hypothetical protein
MNKAPFQQLSAYQARFIEAWTGTQSRKVAMSWPAGAGSVVALTEVVRRLGTHTRVLLIADRVEFAQQFLYRLRETNSPSCFVDRSQFLQLQSAAGSDSMPWSGYQVFALTAAMAEKVDVAASLRKQHWDLVLFLDTTFSTTQRWIGDLQRATTRVLWKVRPGYDISNLDNTEWSIDYLTTREAVQDHGLSGSDIPKMEVRIEMFEPQASELVLFALIEKVIQTTKGTSAERMANILHNRWLSSPASLESGLRRVETALNWQWPLLDDVLEDADEDVVEPSNAFGATDNTKALQLVKECLEVLDELGIDNKLRRLVDYLNGRSAKQSTCVFVRYRDTATYLHSALEDAGLPCALVHGGMSTAEVLAGLHRFLKESGQVLVMTTAMLVGTDLRSVRDLVLYDAPATFDVMSQMLARFHLFGSSPLRVMVIGDTYSAKRTAELIERAAQFVV